MVLKLLLALILMSANYVWANGEHRIHLGLRSAYIIDNHDNESDKSDKDKDQMFYTDYARLGLSGQISESLAYNLRFRLDKSLATTSTSDTSVHDENDGLGMGVDYAYIEHFMGDASLKFGQQAMPVCATEEAQGSLHYFASSAACKSASSYKYQSGISYNHKVGKQKIIVYAGNGSRLQGSETDSDSHAQNTVSYSFAYQGSFFETNLQPIISYTAFHFSEQKNATTGAITQEAYKNQNMAVGIKYNISDLSSNLDYVIYEKESSDVEFSSLNMSFKYMFGRWTPFVRLEQSKSSKDNKQLDTTPSSEYDKKDSYMLGAEFTPWGRDINFDYFLFYRQDKFEDSSAAPVADLEETRIMIGFKLDYTNTL